MIIGIDPGKSGGIAWLMGHDPKSLRTKAMVDDDELVDFFQEIAQDIVADDVRVTIEQIPLWCGAARFARRTIYGASIAKLYGNFKFCEGVCRGLGFKVALVTPQSWQKAVQCQNTERLGKGPWKHKLKARAESLYKGSKITLATSDAVLIMHAGR